MNNFFNNFNIPSNFLGTSNNNFGDLDLNKLLVILLLLTNQLNIEAIHIYKNNFVVSLGTFDED